MQYTFSTPPSYAVRLAQAVRVANKSLHCHRDKDSHILRLEIAPSLVDKLSDLFTTAGYSIFVNKESLLFDVAMPDVYRMQDEYIASLPDDIITPASELIVCTLDAEHRYQINDAVRSNDWQITLCPPVSEENDAYLHSLGFQKRNCYGYTYTYKKNPSAAAKAEIIEILNENLLVKNHREFYCTETALELAADLLTEAGYTVLPVQSHEQPYKLEIAPCIRTGLPSYTYNAENRSTRLIPPNCSIVRDQLSLHHADIQFYLSDPAFGVLFDSFEVMRADEFPELKQALERAGYVTTIICGTLFVAVTSSPEELE